MSELMLSVRMLNPLEKLFLLRALPSCTVLPVTAAVHKLSYPFPAGRKLRLMPGSLALPVYTGASVVSNFNSFKYSTHNTKMTTFSHHNSLFSSQMENSLAMTSVMSIIRTCHEMDVDVLLHTVYDNDDVGNYTKEFNHNCCHLGIVRAGRRRDHAQNAISPTIKMSCEETEPGIVVIEWIAALGDDYRTVYSSTAHSICLMGVSGGVHSVRLVLVTPAGCSITSRSIACTGNNDDDDVAYALDSSAAVEMMTSVLRVDDDGGDGDGVLDGAPCRISYDVLMRYDAQYVRDIAKCVRYLDVSDDTMMTVMINDRAQHIDITTLADILASVSSSNSSIVNDDDIMELLSSRSRDVVVVPPPSSCTRHEPGVKFDGKTVAIKGIPYSTCLSDVYRSIRSAGSIGRLRVRGGDDGAIVYVTYTSVDDAMICYERHDGLIAFNSRLDAYLVPAEDAYARGSMTLTCPPERVSLKDVLQIKDNTKNTKSTSNDTSSNDTSPSSLPDGHAQSDTTTITTGNNNSRSMALLSDISTRLSNIASQWSLVSVTHEL